MKVESLIPSTFFALTFTLLVCVECSQMVAANALNIRSSPHAPVDPDIRVSVKPLTSDEQNALLSKRINGGLGGTFESFANMFVVSSNISTGTTIGLVTESAEIEHISLTPVFADSYEPTLHEFLDAIAKQADSNWSYDPSGNFIHTDKSLQKPIEDIAIFEFKKCEQTRAPYTVQVSANWRTVQMGGVTHYVSPSNIPGMDIYESGKYSAASPDEEAKILKDLPSDIALMWAKRIKPSASKDELTHTHIGKYEAVMFKTQATAKGKQQVTWRNWGFRVGNRGYAILSTILLNEEDKLFPDVEAMLKSLEIKND
jgi:hypothetical protein